jgi:hypothetical protein
MRYLLLSFLFFSLAGTGTALCIETNPDEFVVVPVNIKDEALQKTLEYGQELFLRQEFGQATKLYKHVLTLDPCNAEARETLAVIAKKSPAAKDINDFLNGLKCVPPPIPEPVSEDQNVSTFEQHAFPAVSGKGFQPAAPGTTTAALPAPVKTITITPRAATTSPMAPVAPQPTSLQGATLQEKIADLQNEVQHIEASAQAQNTELNKLNNEQPVTRDQ